MDNFFDLPLEQELLEEMKCKSQTMEVTCGTMIVKEGDQMDYIPMLISGSVRVFHKDDQKDREITLYCVKEKEACMFSYFTLFGDNKSKVFALAEKDSKLLLIPQKLMNEWQFKYQSWHKFMIGTYIHKYELLIESLKDKSFNNLEERIRSYLLKKREHLNSNVIQGTHQSIAQELGTTRVVISRILKKMELEEFLSIGRGRIILN